MVRPTFIHAIVASSQERYRAALAGVRCRGVDGIVIRHFIGDVDDPCAIVGGVLDALHGINWIRSTVGRICDAYGNDLCSPGDA
jgi:hypothetical protein